MVHVILLGPPLLGYSGGSRNVRTALHTGTFPHFSPDYTYMYEYSLAVKILAVHMRQRVWAEPGQQTGSGAF